MAAENLKEGDVANKKVRDLIVREVEDIKSKLDGLSRKDLLAAVDSFETGVRFLFQALDVNPTGGASAATEKTSVGIKEENVDLADVVKIVSFAPEMEKFRRLILMRRQRLLFLKPKRDSKWPVKKQQRPPTTKLLRFFTGSQPFDVVSWQQYWSQW